MNRNLLSSIPDLVPVKDTLRLLSLSFNVMTQLSKNYFRNFTRLDTIHLSCNNLTELPRFTWLEKSMQLIQIQHNSIQSLYAVTADGFYERLSYLDASYNRVQYLNISHLEKFPKLRQLQLQGNRLTTLGDYRAYVQKSRNLELFWNPWHCDSQLIWMTGLPSSRLTCHSPECFTGKAFSEISEYFYRSSFKRRSRTHTGGRPNI